MSKIIDGGQAFPVCDPGVKGYDGMSLRAWLAGKAMTGLLANPEHDILKPEEVAHDAVLHADAMIEALKKEPSA